MCISKIRFLLLLLLHELALSKQQSEDGPDLTLLIKLTKDLDNSRKEYNMTCIATGSEALSYGMTWVFQDDADYINNKKSRVSHYLNLPTIHEFVNGNFLSDKYKESIQNSYDANLPPVIDHRWETFDIHSTEAYIRRIVFNINLSILLEDNSEVEITIDDNHKLKYKTNEQVQYPVWEHLTIYKNGERFSLTDFRDYNKYEKADPFYVNSLSISNGIWKMHDYNFLKIPINYENNYGIFQSEIRLLSECISFFLFTEDSCQVEVTLDSRINSNTETYSTGGNWMEYKMMTHLNKDQYDAVNAVLVVVKRNDCFAAIDDVRHCSLNEIRTLNIINSDTRGCVSLSDQQHLLKYITQQKPKKEIENIQNIGRFNNVTCTDVSGKKYCNRNMICDNKLCYCAPGSQGLNCEKLCHENHWGINCNEKCDCPVDCNVQTGCPVCMKGVISSKCSNPNINATVIKEYATAATFSFAGIENFILTVVICRNVKFSVPINEVFLDGFRANTNNSLKCKFCNNNFCTKDRIVATFLTKPCIDLSKNNILTEVKNTSIKLKVEGLNYDHCPPTMYDVQVTGKVTKKMYNETFLQNLKENTNYLIEILSNNRTVIAWNVTTDFSAPSEPKNVIQKNGNCFEIEPPYYTRINNYTFNFTINENNCEEKYGMYETINTTQHCFNLKYYVTIELNVHANNEKGSSKPFTKKFEIPEIAELGEDERLFDIYSNRTNFNIVLPKCQSTNGPLIYKVVSKCLEEWCIRYDENVSIFNYLERKKYEKIELKKLVKFARHDIAVYVSRINEGPYTHLKNISLKTTVGRPNSVSNLSSYNWDNNNLFIRWKPPYPPTGEIESYEVNYNTGDARMNKTFVVFATSVCKLWKDFVCAKISDVAEDFYSIAVKSKNHDFNIFSLSTTEKIKAGDTTPSEPQIIKATRTSNCDVELEWRHPEFPHGRIKYFKIYNENNQLQAHVQVKDIQEEYSHLLPGFSENNHTIFIKAFNTMEGRQSSLFVIPACEGNSNLSTILISVFSILIVCAIIGVAVMIYMKKVKNRTISPRRIDSPISMLGESVELIAANEHPAEVNNPLKKSKLKNFLVEDCKDSDDNALGKEFAIMSEYRVLLSQKVGLLAENIAKNRFKNIIPYDSTRVILTEPNKGDYINANYVHNTVDEKAYIAAQCPKKETAYDFWRMLWQEQVQLIICLATVSEGSKKIFQYWPEDNIHITFEDILVTHKSNYIETDFVIKHLEMKRGGQKRDILHLNFISWPDHSIPLFPRSLYRFFVYVNELRKNFNTGPTLVHCSAGIGRTGTYIMCESLINTENDEIDIPGFLKKIRNCRSSLVSRENQYKLIYFMLDEHLNGENTSIQSATFLNMSPVEIDEMLLLQYKYTLSRQYAYDMLHPEISTTVELSSIFVDGYQGERKFIAVSQQQKNADRIWWVIDQNDVKTVIVLQQQSIGTNLFWPVDFQGKKVESFTINLEKCSDLDDYIIYNLKYAKGREVKTVQVYYYKYWSGGSRQPDNLSSFMKLYHMYKKLDVEENNKIMLCCQNGIMACGVFIALDLVINKLKSDQLFDISWAVLGIRQHSKSFMGHLEQFKLVHNMVKYYLENEESAEHEYQNVQNNVIYENIKSLEDLQK